MELVSVCSGPSDDSDASLRLSLLRQVADLVPEAIAHDCVLVAVDGVDGAGKTTFADELAHVLRCRGRPVERVSLDDFHNVRAVRYRRGRSSPEGFWLDSYNYRQFRLDVLEPLGPEGSRWYRRAAHDLATDQILMVEPQLAPSGAVVIVDGLFLHRDELVDVWDFSVFLDVGFDVTVGRMAERDGSSADPNHPTMRRYVQGQRLYAAACDPKRRASVVVDNTLLEAPLLRSR